MEEIIKQQFKNHLIDSLSFDHAVVTEAKKVLSKAYFSLFIKNGQLHRRMNYGPKNSKYPCYIEVVFANKEALTTIETDIFKLMTLIPKIPMLKNELDKTKQDVAVLLLSIMQKIPLERIECKQLDGNLCEKGSVEEYLANDILREYLDMFAWIFYITDFMGIDEFFKNKIEEGKNHIFDLVFNEKRSNAVRTNCEIEQKTGSQFFGIDASSMDFSLSAHKDIFTKNFNLAKESMRIYDYPNRDHSLKYWISHLTLRSGYHTWQRSMDLKGHFYDENSRA
jgi:hypothetical protein